MTVEGSLGEGPAARRTVRVLDLFAGAGGLTAGMHRVAGNRLEIVRAVEADKAAAATFKANFGDVVYQGLIQDWLAKEQVPEVDIVVGGPPCQGFSNLGKREEDDSRNTLWVSYAKAVRAAKPRYFVMENVPRFMASSQFPLLEGQTLPRGLLQDYAIEARILNAAEYGSYQVRKRVVIIGHRRDLTSPEFPKPRFARESWRTVEEAWVGLPSISQATRPPPRSIEVDGRPLAGAFRLPELHLMRDYREISLRRFAAIGPGGNRTDLPDELQMDCWRKHKSGSMDVMGRLHLDRPSVTIRTEFTKPEKGRYLHPHENRAISIAEGARLQGFTDDFKFVGSLTQITKQIGNAVPLELGAAIGAHLLEQIPELTR